MRGITKYEMLLAVAMSEFHETTHVLFIPPGTHFRRMLKIVHNSSHIIPLAKEYWKLTEKGWKYLKSHKSKDFSSEDAAIDAFVDSL